MRYSIIFVVILSIPALAFSAVIHVPEDYAKIQEAIDAAVNGDTVLVKPGTYVENIDFKGKAITLQSEQEATVTTIDGNQAGSVMTNRRHGNHSSFNISHTSYGKPMTVHIKTKRVRSCPG